MRFRKEEDFIMRLSFFVFAKEEDVVGSFGRAMRPEPERGFEVEVLVRIEGRFLGAVGALERVVSFGGGLNWGRGLTMIV